MMRHTTTALYVLLAVALFAAPGHAQRTSVELRVGAAIGNYSGTDAGLELVPAPSFAATVGLGLTESAGLYAGINRSSFGCDEALCATRDVLLTSQGVTAGGRYAVGPGWVRAGLAFQQLRVDSDVDTDTADFGVGWDLAAGLDFPVGRGFRVRPGVTYLRHAAVTRTEDGHAALLAFEVGVAMRF
ncbi:MAG: outer membrane beta-barrel protein [Longimicrobiales bacterium]